VVAADVPDLDHFRGSFGGRAVIPLWCAADGTRPNVDAGRLGRLSDAYGRAVGPEALFAYCYALLSTPGYVDRFAEELREPGPRVPLTPDADLFERVARVGRHLVWLHTFGERFGPRVTLPPGRARCSSPIGDAHVTRVAYDAVTETLAVGDGRIEPVAHDVWAFSVSGLRVVPSWLGYRIERPRRRATSPLDGILPRWSAELTRELLELVWVLEASLQLRPELDALLEAVLSGPLDRR
jgi:hypothetical protein